MYKKISEIQAEAYQFLKTIYGKNVTHKVVKNLINTQTLKKNKSGLYSNLKVTRKLNTVANQLLQRQSKKIAKTITPNEYHPGLLYQKITKPTGRYILREVYHKAASSYQKNIDNLWKTKNRLITQSAWQKDIERFSAWKNHNKEKLDLLKQIRSRFLKELNEAELKRTSEYKLGVITPKSKTTELFWLLSSGNSQTMANYLEHLTVANLKNLRRNQGKIIKHIKTYQPKIDHIHEFNTDYQPLDLFDITELLTSRQGQIETYDHAGYYGGEVYRFERVVHGIYVRYWRITYDPNAANEVVHWFQDNRDNFQLRQDQREAIYLLLALHFDDIRQAQAAVKQGLDTEDILGGVFNEQLLLDAFMTKNPFILKYRSKITQREAQALKATLDLMVQRWKKH